MPISATSLLKQLFTGSTSAISSLPKEYLKNESITRLTNIITTTRMDQGLLGQLGGLIPVDIWPLAMFLLIGGAGKIAFSLIKGKKSNELFGIPTEVIDQVLFLLRGQEPDVALLGKFLKTQKIKELEIEKICDGCLALATFINDRNGSVQALVQMLEDHQNEFECELTALNSKIDTVEKKLSEIHFELRYLVSLLNSGPIFERFFTDKSSGANRYLYSIARVPFLGRQNECEILNDFLNSDQKISWLILSGPGGSGKSRLAFELCKKAENYGWLAGKLNTEIDQGKWTNWNPITDTLIFIDYADCQMNKYASALHELFSRNDMKRKIRILLVVRQALENQEWLKEFRSHENHRAYVNQTKFILPARNIDGILEIVPMTDDELWNIISDINQNCIEENNNLIIGKNKISRDSVLDHLKRLDPERRPLYATFAADAIAKGNDIRKWNKKALNEHIINHERHYWRSLCGRNDIQQYERLIALSTLCRGWHLYSTDDSGRPHLTLPTSEILNYFFPFKDSKWEFTLASMIGSFNSDTLPFLEPDILGELFIIGIFQEIASKFQRKEFLREAVKNNPEGVAISISLIFQDCENEFEIDEIFDFSFFSNYSDLSELKKFETFFINCNYGSIPSSFLNSISLMLCNNFNHYYNDHFSWELDYRSFYAICASIACHYFVGSESISLNDYLKNQLPDINDYFLYRLFLGILLYLIYIDKKNEVYWELLRQKTIFHFFANMSHLSYRLFQGEAILCFPREIRLSESMLQEFVVGALEAIKSNSNLSKDIKQNYYIIFANVLSNKTEKSSRLLLGFLDNKFRNEFQIGTFTFCRQIHNSITALATRFCHNPTDQDFYQELQSFDFKKSLRELKKNYPSGNSKEFLFVMLSYLKMIRFSILAFGNICDERKIKEIQYLFEEFKKFLDIKPKLKIEFIEHLRKIDMIKHFKRFEKQLEPYISREALELSLDCDYFA